MVSKDKSKKTDKTKFNPADGKMTVIDGSSVYVAGDYSVYHKPLPMNVNPQNYSGYLRLMQLRVLKGKKQIIEYVVGQEFKMQGVGQASTTYFLEVLEPSGESYPIQRYDAYPDLNVLMVKAIDHAIYFEEHILCGMDPAKFDTLKAEVIAYLKKLHPECKFINFKRCFGNFIFLQFQPQETYYHHSVGVAFDHVNSRYYYLTSLKSYEKFLTTNRIELVGKAPLISEKTAVLLVDLLKLTAALSFNKVFIESNELLLSSPYCTPAVKTEVEQKLAKLDSPVHYARLSGDTIVFYTADYLYPSNLVKWTISEKDGKVSLTNKLLLENLFVPSFILNDSLSPEEGSNYIR